MTSIPALLTVDPTGPAETNAVNFGGVNIQEASGADWNTLNTWTDGLAASVSAIEFPGTTYDIQIGQRVRNPAGSTSSSFPGNTLQVDGPGTVLDGNVAAGNVTGEFRTKHSIDPATVFFPNLILNGGQLDCGDNGTIIIQGQITVGTNAVGTNGIIYVNSGGAGTTRNYEMDAYITGHGSMEYAGEFDSGEKPDHWRYECHVFKQHLYGNLDSGLRHPAREWQQFTGHQYHHRQGPRRVANSL